MADKLLKSIKFPTLPDRYVIGDTSLSEEGAAADAKAVGDALATKADTKGTYEDLIVGGAEQLVADGYETDKEPYLFRPTGGSADVGNREYLDSIVGGTVAWNQLVSESATSVTVQSGHKYIAKIGGAWSVAASSGSAISVTGGTDILIDLTALFNPTIADYIYSLEQSQAGAGVAWFRQYFPENYYPYDAGTLKSVQTSAHKTYDADGNVIGTYPLDSSLTLSGVPKLVDGKLAFDGDVYLPSGEVDRRYKQVTLTGSENWNLENGVSDRGGNPTSRFYIEKNDLKKPSGSANTRDYTNHMNSTIPTLKGGYVNQFDMTGIEMGVTGYQGNSGDDNYLYIIVNNTINTTITTVDALKSWLSSHPLEVVYELETPTTETADGYEQYQRCDPSGTEEFVTTGIVPVGHETRYPHDLKKKIETAPDSPSADGTYLMKRSGGKNTYMALPSTPSANGAYVLTVTVSGGSASYSWAAKG